MKKARWSRILLGLGVMVLVGSYTPPGLLISDIVIPSTATRNSFYLSHRSPLEAQPLIKLPIRSIRPRGWILKYLNLEKNGLTGHLDQISAWLETKDNAWLSPTGQGIHGWEEVPYWLKGFGDIGYLLRDTGMIRRVEYWIHGVMNSQRPDGYFGPLTVENGKPDIWPHMIMLWALQSYYDYTRDPKVIPFITRFFRWELDQPDRLFLKNYWENSRGGDNLYSVYWLYDRTGDPWLLELAAKIHRNTADWEQAGTLPNWHNVNIAQCFREPATYYLQSHDSSDLEATYHDFHLVRDLYGQVPGGMYGADEDARPGYSDPRQAVETCGIVEQMASDELLLRFTGDAFWADHCEDVAFNTYPAAVMPDFRSLRYLTAPNMVVSDDKNHSPGIENAGPFLMMNPFSNRCCQHNHSQGWPYYAENLWMASPDNGLVATLYNSSVVRAKVGDGTRVSIRERTHYPFSESILLEIQAPRAVSFPLYLRIPGWCSTATIWVNGRKIAGIFPPDTYARLENLWKPGDRILLKVPMRVHLKTWTKNKNSVSVNYGPLTFSLKIKERLVEKSPLRGLEQDSRWQKGVDLSQWPAWEIYAASPWNYGLWLGKGNSMATFKLVRKPWPKDNFPFTPGTVPLAIEAEGKQIPSWKVDQYGLCGILPPSPVTIAGSPKPIIMIPMGAARLRISAFPVVQ